MKALAIYRHLYQYLSDIKNQLYEHYLPVPLQIELDRFFNKKRYVLRKEIIAFLKREMANTGNNSEKCAVLNFLLKNPLRVFPYKYNYNHHVKVYYDKQMQRKYVLHNAHRMYFPDGWNSLSIQRYYNNLLQEQAIDSPHRYMTDNFQIKENDIIVDVGAAEGIWALDLIEKAKVVYLFECDEKWIDALRKTFEPWKNKVHIINKQISNVTNQESITLADFFYQINSEAYDLVQLGGGRQNNLIIKADIEGAEALLLEGSIRILKTQSNIKMVLCTYHKQDDMDNFKQILDNYGFYTEHSGGYMLFFPDKSFGPPYLRRGLIRASK